MEAQGLIWAWGEGGKDAETEAMMTPPLLVGEIEGIGKSGRAACGGFRNHWQVRDLPYGWNAFFENAIDPAHAVVSHHTLVGSRYDDPAGFQCVVERPVTDAGGFRCHRSGRAAVQHDRQIRRGDVVRFPTSRVVED